MISLSLFQYFRFDSNNVYTKNIPDQKYFIFQLVEKYVNILGVSISSFVKIAAFVKIVALL